jgi:hypothetical protein
VIVSIKDYRNGIQKLINFVCILSAVGYNCPITSGLNLIPPSSDKTEIYKSNSYVVRGGDTVNSQVLSSSKVCRKQEYSNRNEA